MSVILADVVRCARNCMVWGTAGGWQTSSPQNLALVPHLAASPCRFRACNVRSCACTSSHTYLTLQVQGWRCQKPRGLVVLPAATHKP